MGPERKSTLVNLDEAHRGRAASEVLASIDWDRDDVPGPDPEQLSAAEFLGRLVDE